MRAVFRGPANSKLTKPSKASVKRVKRHRNRDELMRDIKTASRPCRVRHNMRNCIPRCTQSATKYISPTSV